MKRTLNEDTGRGIVEGKKLEKDKRGERMIGSGRGLGKGVM